jgi:hypothetical protein
MAKPLIKPDPELLAAARAAYQVPTTSFWEELTERLYPAETAAAAEVEPLPRTENSRTV